MGIGTALLAASVGQQLYSAVSGGIKDRRMRRKKSSYFDSELKPLLDEATQEQDVDLDALYDAEMTMPLMNIQEGFRSLGRSTDSARGQSGFQSSGFIDNDYADQSNVLQGQFANQKFQNQRGIIDLQSQLESITADNKLRAKELEYSYKYG